VFVLFIDAMENREDSKLGFNKYKLASFSPLNKVLS